MHFIFPQRVLQILLLYADLLRFRVVYQTFFVHQVLQEVFRWLKIVPVPVVRLILRDFLPFHVLLEKRVQETFFHRNSLIGVETQHLGQKIREFGGDAGE